MVPRIQACTLCFAILVLALVESRSWQHGQLRAGSGHHRRTAHEIADLERLLLDREQQQEQEEEEQHQLFRRRKQQHRTTLLDEEDDRAASEESSLEEPDDYEDLIERQRVSSLRHRHPHHQRLRLRHRRPAASELDPLELAERSRDDYGVKDLLRNYARGKRYNGGYNNQRYRTWTDEDRKAFEASRQGSNNGLYNDLFEVEVKEAQNSSLCNYTVIPIPDPGGRIPRELEHVKCNHVGSRCQDKGTFCCLQTYRNVEVHYEDGKTEIIKVYSGCVCSLQIYGNLKPFNPNLPTND